MLLKIVNEGWDFPDASAESMTKDKYLVACNAYSRRIDLCTFTEKDYDDDEPVVIKSFYGFRVHVRNRDKFKNDFDKLAKKLDLDELEDEFEDFAYGWGYKFGNEDSLANFEYDWNRENDF